MQSDQSIEKDYPPEGEFIQVEDWRVHYIQEGAGPDILLIHGAGGSTRDMTFCLMPELTRRFRVTAIDRPSHGWTSGGPEKSMTTPQEQARLLLKLIEKIYLDRPIVLGQSYGDAVALAMAVQDQSALSGLCLVSAAASDHIPAGTQSMEMLTRLETVRAATLATISSPRFIELALMKLFAPQGIPDGYGEHLGVGMTYRERTFRHHMLQASQLESSLKSMMTLYSNISLPVEIIHGDQDVILDFEKHGLWLSNQIEGSYLTRLKGVGHIPHHICHEKVSECVFRIALSR